MPHRILILDNDEATGSYYILFALYDLFAMSNFGKTLNSHKVLEILVEECEASGVFRPGLREFLTGVYKMKERGLIDKVCIYTNQLDIRDVPSYPHWVSADGLSWSVPSMIAYMFNVIVGGRLIDRLYTRPVEYNSRNEYPVKDLYRVFSDLYPGEPVDLSMTYMIDDVYDKRYIVDSSKSGTDANVRIPIPPYRQKLATDTFYRIVQQVWGGWGLNSSNSALVNSINSSWLHRNSSITNAGDGNALRDISYRLEAAFKGRRSTNKHVKGGKNKRRTSKRRASYFKTTS